MRLRINEDVATEVGQPLTSEHLSSGQPVLYAALLPRGPINVIGDTALTIWQCLDGRTEDEVVETVAAIYDLPAEAVRPAVLDCLDDFRGKGLVVG